MMMWKKMMKNNILDQAESRILVELLKQSLIVTVTTIRQYQLEIGMIEKETLYRVQGHDKPKSIIFNEERIRVNEVRAHYIQSIIDKIRNQYNIE